MFCVAVRWNTTMSFRNWSYIKARRSREMTADCIMTLIQIYAVWYSVVFGQQWVCPSWFLCPLLLLGLWMAVIRRSSSITRTVWEPWWLTYFLSTPSWNQKRPIDRSIINKVWRVLCCVPDFCRGSNSLFRCLIVLFKLVLNVFFRQMRICMFWTLNVSFLNQLCDR